MGAGHNGPADFNQALFSIGQVFYQGIGFVCQVGCFKDGHGLFFGLELYFFCFHKTEVNIPQGGVYAAMKSDEDVFQDGNVGKHS